MEEFNLVAGTNLEHLDVFFSHAPTLASAHTLLRPIMADAAHNADTCKILKSSLLRYLVSYTWPSFSLQDDLEFLMRMMGTRYADHIFCDEAFLNRILSPLASHRFSVDNSTELLLRTVAVYFSHVFEVGNSNMCKAAMATYQQWAVSLSDDIAEQFKLYATLLHEVTVVPDIYHATRDRACRYILGVWKQTLESYLGNKTALQAMERIPRRWVPVLGQGRTSDWECVAVFIGEISRKIEAAPHRPSRFEGYTANETPPPPPTHTHTHVHTMHGGGVAGLAVHLT